MWGEVEDGGDVEVGYLLLRQRRPDTTIQPSVLDIKHELRDHSGCEELQLMLYYSWSAICLEISYRHYISTPG